MRMLLLMFVNQLDADFDGDCYLQYVDDSDDVNDNVGDDDDVV